LITSDDERRKDLWGGKKMEEEKITNNVQRRAELRVVHFGFGKKKCIWKGFGGERHRTRAMYAGRNHNEQRVESLLSS